MKHVTDGLPLFQAHHGWLARVAEDRELVDVDWRNERSMNSARHEGVLAKSASHLHLIALALSDKSVEEMVSLLKAEPDEDYDKKPTASEPGQDRCRRCRLLSTYQSQILQETVNLFKRVQQRTVGHVPVP